MASQEFSVEESTAGKKLILDIDVPFSSEREAEIVYEVLRVDKEPPRSQISKTLTREKNILHVNLKSPSASQLRTSANGFFDHLVLVCETMVNFGPIVSQEYSH